MTPLNISPTSKYQVPDTEYQILNTSNMKSITLLTALLLTAFYTFAQLTQPPNGDNQKSVTTQYIGSLAHVTVTYNSPDVHAPNGDDRSGKIWGQLEPYGLNNPGFGTSKAAPWRAGSNENTTFEFSHDVTIQGKPLKAGKYGFHIILAEKGAWTLIFSNNAAAWGSYFYNDKEDALRVEATPETSEYHEWLTYEFMDRKPESTTIALMWDKIKLPFTIAVPNMKELYVDKMRSELQNDIGFDHRNWAAGAAYLAENNMNLDEALVWADYAISGPFIGQEDFQTLQTKSMVLRKLNRTAEAQQTMDKAIKHSTADVQAIHAYGRQLMAAGDKKKALEIFEYNHKRFNGAWPTNVGLARAYSANGIYDKALKHAQLALPQATDEVNKKFLTEAIEKLKKKQDIN